MEISLHPICVDYYSAEWERNIELKLNAIANGKDYFWREKLISLHRGTSRRISLNTPNEGIKKEIIEMIRNKVIFQTIITGLACTIACSSDLCDFEGNTLLHHAVTVGKQCTSIQALDFLKNILVDQEKNLLKKNREGMTPFQFALCHGKNKITRKYIFPFLLQKYLENSFAIAEIEDRYKRTCLHLMAAHFHDPGQNADLKTIQIIKKFMESVQGTLKLDAQDTIGLTAFDYAIIYGNYSVAQLLLDAGANPLAGICSMKLNIDEVMKAFEQRKSEESRRLDFLSTYEGEARIPDKTMLIELKSKNFTAFGLRDAIALFRQSFNSLSGVSTEGRGFLCEELIKVVALTPSKEINTQDDQGFTLLHIAALSEACDIIKMIMKKGGDVNKASNNKLTPVGLSIIRGKIKSLDLMLKTSKILVCWPGVDVPKSTSLAFYALSTCKNARLFELVLKIENIKPGMLYTDTNSKTVKTLNFLDWAMKLNRPIAIFVLIKQGGALGMTITNKLEVFEPDILGRLT